MISILNLKREYRVLKRDIDCAIKKELSYQQWILSPTVKKFEEKVAEYLGARYTIGVNSGTDALVISLRTLAIIKRGEEFFSTEDEIITTPFTFVATAEAILRCGARPVFVDIDPRTFNIDPVKVKEAINRRTVGIVVVHLFGLSCAIDEILILAKKYRLFVIEDCAQSFGAEFKGKKVGTFGDLGAFSFFPSKNLGGFGDGGMIVTSLEKYYKIAKMLRHHGGKNKYNVLHLGYNSRLDSLQAAILSVKLRYLDKFNSLRQNLAHFYNQHLSGLKGIITPCYPDYVYHVYHQYTLRIKGEKRDKLKKYLSSCGITSAVYYPHPLHKTELFCKRAKYFSLPEAERVSKEVLSLPMDPFLSIKERKRIVSAIKRFFS